MVHTTGTTIATRAHRLDPAVRQRLFATATEAFVRQGYERASLNAILTTSQMGKSTFFYYFLDKEDLFASVIEAAIVRVASAVGQVVLPEKPERFWPETTAIIGRWGAAAAAEPGFVGLLRALQPLRPTASPRLMRTMHEVRQVYRSLLNRGIKFGLVRRDLAIDTLMALTDAVDLVLDEDFHRKYPHPDADTLQAHRLRVIEMVQRLIRP